LLLDDLLQRRRVDSIDRTDEEGAAPGGGHGRPPRERARRPSRGRAEGAPWRTTGDARKAGVVDTIFGKKYQRRGKQPASTTN